MTVVRNLTDANQIYSPRRLKSNSILRKLKTDVGTVFDCRECSILIDSSTKVHTKQYSYLQARTYAIRGRSGSGKTTYLDILSGIYKPYLLESSSQKIDIGYLPQSSFLPETTVQEYILGASSLQRSQFSYHEVLESLGLLEVFNIEDLLSMKISSTNNSLSGGQLRRLHLQTYTNEFRFSYIRRANHRPRP